MKPERTLVTMTRSFVPALARRSGRALVAAALAVAWPAAAGSPASVPDEARLRAMTARFAPVDIGADVAALPAGERQALAKLVEAARIIDALFLRQVWAGNEALLLELLADETPARPRAAARLPAQQGPVVAARPRRAVRPGRARPSPSGANFYPAGATKAEVEALDGVAAAGARSSAAARLLHHHPPRRRRQLRRRALQRRVPGRAGARGRRCCARRRRSTAQPTLEGVPREARGRVPLATTTTTSDVAWMELDAAHRADHRSVRGLRGRVVQLQGGVRGVHHRARRRRDARSWRASAPSCRTSRTTCRSIPTLRNPKLGALAPIRVVNVVFCAGDGNRGVQTAAFNLPNDERVVREKGTKRVMLKNVQEAKFEKVLRADLEGRARRRPIRQNVAFDAFFTHILMHELMHGLGPHNIAVGGRQTTVRQELKETYSALEEAKADISGLWALQHLVDKGVLDRGAGADDVHDLPGLGLPLDPLRRRRGARQGHRAPAQLPARRGRLPGGGRTARSRSTPPRSRTAVTALTREIMTIAGRGRLREGARRCSTGSGWSGPRCRRVLDRLSDVPVDIEPRFVTAEALTRR